jgi:geranylgeranyl diphosphate synthase type II
VSGATTAPWRCSHVDISSLLERERLSAEEALARWLPGLGDYPETIHEAIRYSVMGGGKRLRPIVATAAARALGSEPDAVVRCACAVEYVHCCSLVLDDLPSMDDASMRRGRPTTHKMFGVATGILAADALLMHAFKLIADNGVDVGADGPRMAEAIRSVATAVGSYGMVGGQHVDLMTTAGAPLDAETLEYIQSRKTGSLFVVAATIGGTLLGAPQGSLDSLGRYARKLGLAYQIVDDILDAVGDVSTVGKDVRQDEGKITFVTLHGVDAAREEAASLLDEALAALEDLDGDADVLRGVAQYCLSRTA